MQATTLPGTTAAPPAGPAPVGAAAQAVHPGAVLALVLATYLMVIVDTSVVITGLPQIQADLGFTTSGVAWVQSAYTLAFGGLLLLGARAGDVLGRRPVLLTGLVLFSAASLAVGAAPTAGLLVAARALQGVGAAVLAPSTLALLTATFPEGPERQRAVVAYGSVAGVGTAFGLVLGGLLADLWSWRVAFAVNVPLGAALAVLALRTLPAGTRSTGRFDLLGTLTSTLGMTALVHGIVRAADHGWTDRVTLASLAAGLVLLAAFVRVERTAAQPVLPLHLLADRARVGAYVARFCFIGAIITYFLFVSQYLQDVRGWSALAAGLAFLPMTAVNFAVALAVPRLLGRLGATPMLVGGLVLAIAGTAWLTTLSPTSGFALHVAVPGMLIGAGQGLLFAPLTAAGLARVNPAEAGAASGAINAFHQLGSAVGLSLTVALAAALAPAHAEAAVRLTGQVTAALAGASLLLAVALVVTLALVVRPTPASRHRRPPVVAPASTTGPVAGPAVPEPAVTAAHDPARSTPWS